MKNEKMVDLLLKTIKNQETLDLAYSYGDVGDEEAILIAKVLKKDPPLKHLYLSGNDITNKGAKALLKALKINTHLEILDINHNEISDKLIVKIAEALEEKRSRRNLLAVSTEYGGMREEVLSTLKGKNK